MKEILNEIWNAPKDYIYIKMAVLIGAFILSGIILRVWMWFKYYNRKP